MRCFIAILLVPLFLIPSFASAAEFEVTGWIPYWAASAGARDARSNLDVLTSVMPFAYSLQPSGDFKDLAGMNKSTWQRLMKDAKKKDVTVIPTFMASNGATIHTLLSDRSTRQELVEEIVSIVEEEDYDGADIDFEGKKASTRTSFSLFLKELRDELDGKILSCTIEARTPPSSLYRVVPATIEYANDLKDIGKYCDRVNVMTYDQQRADLTLNGKRKGTPYYPVADPEWVEKVIKLMDNDIPKEKMRLGVATYGREVQVKVSPQWFESYTQVRAVNPDQASDTAKKFKVKPFENNAGEQSFTYVPKDAAVQLRDFPDAPKGTPKGEEAALRALAYANKTGKSVYVNMVWWSDADAIEEKVELAKELGLAGVAIFKIDGGEDEDIWDLF